MAKYKQPDVDQNQIVILNFAELFPDDHPVARLLELVRSFDLREFDAGYDNETVKGGRPAMPVDRILSLIIYSLLNGNLSMRNLERDLTQRADLMFLSGGMRIDHSTFARFRKRHADAVLHLFTQTVFMGVEAGLIDLDTVCADSTAIKASANRRDIGTDEELKRRYTLIEESCAKRHDEWQRAESEDEKKQLERKISKLQGQNEKIARARKFLAAHPAKRRVHMTDPDADWQKDGSGQFIVGYRTQIAVDHKSRMIVFQDVRTNQSDSPETVPIVEHIEEFKREAMPGSVGETKYAMDCGYASAENLEKLADRDLYIPDREFAHYESGGKLKPEDRAVQAGPDELLTFTYDRSADTFTCPAGGTLHYRREKKLKGDLYREYGRSGCGKCSLRDRCAGPQGRNKELWTAAKHLDRLQHKNIPPYGRKRGMAPILHPQTLAMREKLRSKAGREVYARRFPVAEGVIGVMKEIRSGWQFLRRTVLRVRVEHAERSIAHNLARLIGFTRGVSVPAQ